MNHELKKIKAKLYEEYEEELTNVLKEIDEEIKSMRESGSQDEGNDLAEHLRLRYTRQNLMCLRAARAVAPPTITENKRTEERDRLARLHEIRSWDDKEREQKLHEAELEELILATKEKNASVDALRMRRIQSEAVRLLRSSIIEQDAYQENKKKAAKDEEKEAPQEANGIAEKKANEKAVDKEESALPYASSVAPVDVHRENLDIVKQGGTSGESFTAQRLHILDQIEHQMRAEAMEAELQV